MKKADTVFESYANEAWLPFLKADQKIKVISYAPALSCDHNSYISLAKGSQEGA